MATITGDSGNNLLYATSSADSIDGGAGNDTLSYASSNAGVSVKLGTSGWALYGYATDDSITGIENLIGSTYNDSFTGYAYIDSIFEGGVGSDVLIGGLYSNNTASYSGSSAGVSINLYTNVTDGGDAEGDTLTNIQNLIGSAYDDTLVGYSTDNIFRGGAGADSIDGTYIGQNTASYEGSNAGVNVNIALTTAQSGGHAQGDILSYINHVVGSAYNDTLTGNGYANLLDGADGDDTFIGSNGADTLEGGVGINTVSYAASADRVDVDLTKQFTSSPAQSDGDAEGDILQYIRNLIGSSYNDILTGDGAHNTIEGGAGADTINAGGGTDIITYVNSNAAVNVDLTVTSAQTGGHAQGDILSNFENIIGSSYADTLTGSSGANTISAAAGDDTLAGGAGADSLDGGTGVDTASYAASSEGVSLNMINGTNAGGDALDDVLANIENVIGSAYADSIAATDGANSVTGGAGNDSLYGQLGNDTLNGGDGNDYLEGHYGADSLVGGAGADSLSGGWDNDTLIGSDGDDTLIGYDGADSMDGGTGTNTASYTDSGPVSINMITGTNTGGEAQGDTLVNIQNVIGSANADWIAATDGANSVTGGGGNDSLYGQLGNDTLNGGDGNDYLEGHYGADSLIGGGGADSLFGGWDNDTLLGSDGDDTLIGYDGADSMDGGTGTNTVSYTDSGPVSINMITGTNTGGEAQGDTLVNIQNVIGSANADWIAATDGANSVTGGAGNDSLYGQLGNDTLNGGDGNDYLEGHYGADSLVGGAGADSLSGGWDNDTLYGGTGNDTLDGYDAADLICGGDGIDYLIGGGGSDTFRFESASESGFDSGNRDVISDFSHAAGDLIDVSQLSGTFTFIGGNDFSWTANEARFYQSGSNTIAQFDVDGNASADFEIVLTGLLTLLQSDFLL